MFKLIPTMRRGSSSGIPAAWARYDTVAAARIGAATLFRDDRILRQHRARRGSTGICRVGGTMSSSSAPADAVSPLRVDRCQVWGIRLYRSAHVHAANAGMLDGDRADQERAFHERCMRVLLGLAVLATIVTTAGWFQGRADRSNLGSVSARWLAEQRLSQSQDRK
jgi:hypothetical protein